MSPSLNVKPPPACGALFSSIARDESSPSVLSALVRSCSERVSSPVPQPRSTTRPPGQGSTRLSRSKNGAERSRSKRSYCAGSQVSVAKAASIADVQRELQPHVGAAALAAPSACPAAVRGGDRGHDREAEPGAAARAGAVCTGEPLEGVLDEVRRKAGPLVRHVEFDRVASRDRTQGDLPGAVAQRVVDQVRERLLESGRIAPHVEPRGALRSHHASGLPPAGL